MAEETRILLVDDEPLVMRSLEKTLLRAGYDVGTAGDARTGLVLFQTAREGSRPFNLAILDLRMSNLEGKEDAAAGLELLSKLLEVQANLPVIVLTAFDEIERAKDAVRRGARAYFVKGREAELVEIVKNVLEGDK